KRWDKTSERVITVKCPGGGPNLKISVRPLSSLCLCGEFNSQTITTEAQRTQRMHREEPQGQMKKRMFKLWAAGGTLFLLVLLVACQSKQVQKPPVPVKVATVELHVANSGARYSATIIPRTQVELAFKVDGYVEALQKVRGVDGRVRDLQEGDAIVAGAVLARVRQSDYQVKVREAESQASEARSAIDASKAQYQEALSAIKSSKAQLADAEAAYE